MHFTAKQAVDLGAKWLDRHYPGWVNSIDLSILDIGACQRCVLGQIWSGHIPTDEKNQLIGQVMTTQISQPLAVFSLIEADLGYDIMYHVHGMLPRQAFEMGFAQLICQDKECPGYVDGGCAPNYIDLLDAWMTKIIQRRLDVHPDIVAGCSELNRIASEQYASVS